MVKIFPSRQQAGGWGTECMVSLEHWSNKFCSNSLLVHSLSSTGTSPERRPMSSLAPSRLSIFRSRSRHISLSGSGFSFPQSEKIPFWQLMSGMIRRRPTVMSHNQVDEELNAWFHWSNKFCSNSLLVHSFLLRARRPNEGRWVPSRPADSLYSEMTEANGKRGRDEDDAMKPKPSKTKFKGTWHPTKWFVPKNQRTPKQKKIRNTRNYTEGSSCNLFILNVICGKFSLPNDFVRRDATPNVVQDESPQKIQVDSRTTNLWWPTANLLTPIKVCTREARQHGSRGTDG